MYILLYVYVVSDHDGRWPELIQNDQLNARALADRRVAAN